MPLSDDQEHYQAKAYYCIEKNFDQEHYHTFIDLAIRRWKAIHLDLPSFPCNLDARILLSTRELVKGLHRQLPNSQNR